MKHDEKNISKTYNGRAEGAGNLEITKLKNRVPLGRGGDTYYKNVKKGGDIRGGGGVL